MKIDREAGMTIQCLTARGQSRGGIAQLLAVSDGTVRYHLRREVEGALDGRARQCQVAEGWSEAIAHYLETQGQGPVNLAALHDWLLSEDAYSGSLRSLQRYHRAVS